VRLRYSWVDICRREDDRALLLRLVLGRVERAPELRLLRMAELRPDVPGRT
jgi:hypothetical protein